MSQTCPKCGALVSSVAKKCYSCGAELEAEPKQADFFEMEEVKPLGEYKAPEEKTPEYRRRTYSPDTYSAEKTASAYRPASMNLNSANDERFYNPAAQTDKKPMWVFFGSIIVAVLIALIILINGSGITMSREDKALVKPVQNVLTGVVESNFDLIMSTYPPEIKDSILQQISLGYFTEEDFMSMFDGMFEALGLEPGDISFDIKLKDKKKLSQSKISDMEGYANDSLDYSLSIDDAYSISINIITKYDGQRNTESLDYVVIKIDGGWYLGDFLQE